MRRAPCTITGHKDTGLANATVGGWRGGEPLKMTDSNASGVYFKRLELISQPVACKWSL